MTFQPRHELPGLDPEAKRALVEVQDAISRECRRLEASIDRPRRRCTELVEEGQVIAKPGEVVRVQPGDENITVVLPEPDAGNGGADIVVSFEGDGTAAGKVLVVPMSGTCGAPGTQTLNSPGTYTFTSTGSPGAKRFSAATPTDAPAPPAWSGPPAIVTEDLPDDGVTNDKLDEMPANSVKVNATGSAANPTDLAIAADSFLGRLAGVLASVPLADVDSASVIYDAASHTFQSAATTGDVTSTQNSNARAFRAFSALSVLARAANSSGIPTELAAGANDRVLARASDALAFQQVSTGMIADDAVTDAKLRESAAVSVLGRAANSTGNPADIAAGANNRVLARTGDALSFQQITAPMMADGTVVLSAGTYHDLVIADTVTDIICNGVVTITGIAGGTNGRVVRIAGGNSSTLTLPHGSGSSTAGNTFTMPAAVDYVQARGGAVLVYDTAPSTDSWRCIATAQPTLDGDRGDITVSGLTWTIDNDAVTDAKLRNSAALSVIGRASNSSGDPADIAAGANDRLLARTGDALSFVQLTAGMVPNDLITDVMLRNSAALSVIGRSANSTGDPADIAAANDGEVLRRSGTTLGFGTIATGGIANNAVTDAKIRDSAALSVIGRSANSSGDPADIAAGTDAHVLRRSGTSLGFGTVATAGLADSSVTRSKLSPGVQSFTTAGLSSDVQINTDTTVLRVDTGNSAWSIDGFVRQGGNFNGDWFILENASNNSSTGTLVTGGSSASTAGNTIVTPFNVDRGPQTRYSALMVYDGTDSLWRIVADTFALVDGDKGDITVSASGATFTIDSAAVTLAKQANLAQSTIIGRAEGAGTGVPQALTPTQVVSIIDGESPTWTASHRFNDFIQFGTSTGLPSSGDIRKAGSIRVESGGSVTLAPTDTLGLLGAVSMASALTVSTSGSIDNLTIGNVSVVRFTNATDVTGMIAVTAWQVVWLLNASSNTINLHRESGSSSSSNRWAGTGGSSLIIRPGEMQAAVYDLTSSRWRSLSGAT